MSETRILPTNKKEFRTFIIHKPRGCISATVDAHVTDIVTRKGDPRIGERVGGESRKTVYDLALAAGFPNDCGLVGRLDCETSGIMIFTDDSALSRAIINPVDEGSEHFKSPFKSKEYVVQLIPSKGHDPAAFDPIALEHELSKPFSFSRLGILYQTSPAEVCFIRCWHEEEMSYGRCHLGWIIEVRVILREGKHHQIRRMARRSNYSVHRLERIRIANILSLESIPNPGDCRWLSPEELSILYGEFKLH